MSTWYDPQAGDDRREQLLRLQRLPDDTRWVANPPVCYRHYQDDVDPQFSIACELRASGAYRADPQAEDHIAADAQTLWTWACRWKQDHSGYRQGVQRRLG